MNAKTKKFLIIVGFIILVLILAFLLYLVFFKKPVVIEPEEELPTEVLPRLPVSREDWERMTVSERIQQDLPLVEWPEEDLAPMETISTEAEVIVAQIDEVAQGRKTWVSPVVIDPVKGATLSANGDNSIYYDPKTGYFYETDYLGNKTLMSNQVFYNVQDINLSLIHI